MYRKLTVLLLSGLFLLFSCTTTGSGKQAGLVAEKASQLFQDQEYTASAQLYKEAVLLDPSQASYQYNEQLALFHLGEFIQVVEKSNVSFQHFPTHLSFLFLQAKALAGQSQYEQALRVYQSIFSLNPTLYAEKLEVATQAANWGFREQAKTLALSLVQDHQKEKDAFTLLASIEEEGSWYDSLAQYLTKGDATQSQEPLPGESSTVDESSSDEAQEKPEQDRESSP